MLIFTATALLSQNIRQLQGVVKGSDGAPVPFANIRTQNDLYGTVSKEDGSFSLTIPRSEHLLRITSIGYADFSIDLDTIQNLQDIKITMEVAYTDIGEVAVTSLYNQSTNLIKIEQRDIAVMPDITGNVESLIKTMPGVSTTSELSSQYNVRGGNFDENLVYVNDIQIYRPLLIRSGKQEGMSFINSDMISSIQFSAGGFDAKYGDKMSSVLDIKYSRPKEFGGNVSLSALGATAHIQDGLLDNKLSYNLGVRYKTGRYVLNTLDTEGNYDPDFYDVQTYLSYRFNRQLELSFLGNYALNRYQFIPQTRETTFGTWNDALSLRIYYEGGEVDRFETTTGALAMHYTPSEKVSLKLIASSFATNESETFDILGQYYLNELDRSMSSDTYGDSILNIGVGSFLDHARNYLNAQVYSFEHKGGYFSSNNEIRWGIKYNHEIIDDQIKEWKLLDSAGYAIPYDGEEIILSESYRSNNYLQTNRLSAYIQDVITRKTDKGSYFFNMGVRAGYWDYNEQLFFSPRGAISFKPQWNRYAIFRLASGYYYQPPFYKELRKPDGSLNKDLKAQESFHLVGGMEYEFRAWDRPFKLFTEVYYKKYENLVPYKVDNVRITYAGENIASGYAYGLDFKINGEFVQGIESWASLSLMKSEENIAGDFFFNDEGERIEPGYYPRPTDQRLNFSLFFQDYLPVNPTYRMQLSMHYGSRLPFTAPYVDRYDQTFRMPAYRRVDIGFSKVILSEENELKSQFLNSLKSIWISAEVFNLLDINNTISYLWIKTVDSQVGSASYYAVPNYLTSRRLNIKLSVKF